MPKKPSPDDKPNPDDPNATLREQVAAKRRWLADAGSSSDPKERLFAAVYPWVADQMKKWRKGPLENWDVGAGAEGEGILQHFQTLLWEAVHEWDQERATHPKFDANPTGVVIMKVRSKISKWYAKQKEEYWATRLLDARMGWEEDTLELELKLRARADTDPDPKGRRKATEALKILDKIGKDEEKTGDGDTDSKKRTRERVRRFRAKRTGNPDPIEKLRRLSLSASQAFDLLVALHGRPVIIPLDAARGVLLAVPGAKDLWEKYLSKNGGYEGLRESAKDLEYTEARAPKPWGTEDGYYMDESDYDEEPY